MPFERDDVCAVVTQVVVNGIAGLLPDRDNALFVSLANHTNQPVDEVHFGELQIDELRHPKAATVKHLKHRFVSHAFATAHVHSIDDLLNFLHRQHIGQFAFRTRSLDQLYGVGVHDAFDAQVFAEASDSAQHAGLAVACQTTVVQVTQKAFHVRQLDVHRCLHSLLVHRKFHELFDVPHVRQHRILAQSPFEDEVIVIALHRGLPVSGARRHAVYGIQFWFDNSRAS